MKARFKMLIFALAILVCLTMALGSCGGDEDTGSSSSTESSTATGSVNDSANTSASSNVGTTDSSAPSVDESTPTEDSKPTDSSVSTGDSQPSTDSSKSEDKPCDHKGGTATCTALAVCTECGEEYGVLAAHDEQYEVIAPTCVEGGITNVTCANCDYTATKDETAATGVHVYDVKGEVVEPDCENGGYTVYSCSAGECGTTENKDLVDAKGHDEQYEVIAPTCVAGGITNVTCSRCSYTATKDETAATGAHVYDVKGEVVAPDCENGGYTVYGCSAGECGTTEQKDPKDALGHEYTTFVEEFEPTCALDGYKVYKCVRCDDTNNVETDQKATGNHELEFFKTVAPTCVEVGHNLYKCKTCDLTWKNPDPTTPNEPVPEEVVDMVDHDFSEATADGLIECYLCGGQYRDITSVPTTGDEAFCMGCGKDPCECGSVNEWAGYTPAEAPNELTANTAFVKDGIQIGGGLIALSGESETTYTIRVYGTDSSEPTEVIIEVSGDLVYVFLGEYAEVTGVEITATTNAYAQLYAPAE